MADQQSAQGMSDRNQNFGSGMVGGQVDPPPSMMQSAQRYNAMIPRSFTPSGSPNGMSSNQYKNTLGGMVPVDNGMGQSQYTTTMGGRFRSPNGISSQNYDVQRYFGESNE